MLFVAMGGHLITTFISLFLFHDIFLVGQNIFSFCFYGVIEVLWRKKDSGENVFTFMFLVILELLFQCAVSAIYIGWEGGYQNFCFIVFTTSFLNIYEKDRQKSIFHSKVIQTCSIAVYTFISIRCHVEAPIKEFSPEHLTLIRQSNAFIIFLIGAYLASVFNARYRHSITKLKREADFDELTQLNNRHAIRKYFDEVRHDREENGTEFGICILDIDDFKKINDSYGHNIGDEVLKAIAAALKSIESDTLSVCRWGGEEFLVISQYGSYKQNFVSTINLLRNSISEIIFNFPEKNICFSITMTAGCAFSDTGLKVHEIIDQADNRLYWGKRNGKNKTIFSDN